MVAEQQITPEYAVYNSDCMEVLSNLKPNSIHFSVYSPPFPELYQYSNDPRDMSNCVSYEEGMRQFEFVINEIHRITMPGRATAVHCMDLKKSGDYQRDFPGDIIRLHEKAGFNFFSRVTIWKDPWLIARRTRMRSLMHKMIVNDSTMCRMAGPDYVLIFKKSGKNECPVTHPNGLKEYAGETQIPEWLAQEYRNYKGDQRKNLLSHWIWRRYASPVWMDIRSGNLLPFKEARENEEEKHVCPLQLDVIERLLTLYSNPGEIVLSPFGGVGSEPFTALKMGRRAIAAELKPSYYRQLLKNLEMTNHPEQMSIFADEIAALTIEDEVMEGDGETVEEME